MPVLVTHRTRKSKFVRLFTHTPEGVVCPHFYELILSNGCPYDCAYCYLKLTFRGKTAPTLFTNNWEQVRDELDAAGPGMYNTGELADSLAVCPPLLETAMDYFASAESKQLLLVTKSANIRMLLNRTPSPNVIVSFSVNSGEAAQLYERGAPPPSQRLDAARLLKERGWRVRVRIDPMILDHDLGPYAKLCELVAELNPERITLGTLRQYPGVHCYSRRAPREGLRRSKDGRMRYDIERRISAYSVIARWLGAQPALCKETSEVWEELGWSFYGCNCTP